MTEPYGDGAVDIGVPKDVRIRFGSFVEATPVRYLEFLIAMAQEKLRSATKETVKEG